MDPARLASLTAGCFAARTPAALLAVLVLLAPGATRAGFQNRDSAAWWVSTYEPAVAAEDPLVERALAIFQKVAAAADKSSDRLPRLVVIKRSGDPYAAAIRDGSIVLTQGAIRLCYQGVSLEKGDSRLAFVLGHELAHQAGNHYWHQAAFEAVQGFAGEEKIREALLRHLRETGDVADDARAREVAKVKELQADADGLIYAVMAGYDPAAVLTVDGTNFFEAWVSQVTGKTAYDNPVHPSAAERATFLRAQLAPVVDQVDYFRFGVRLYQAGRYDDAVVFLERFRERFPGREVFGDIGLARYEAALAKLGECDPALPLRFKLATVLDDRTLASAFRSTGRARGDAERCFRDGEFRLLVDEAARNFRTAASKDPSHLPSRVNLASALILAGDYAGAIAACDEVLRLDGGCLPALNNRGVALFLFSQAAGADLADSAIAFLRGASTRFPGAGAPLYNVAAILEERNRRPAKEAWLAFLATEGDGPFADRARQRAGLAPQPAGKPGGGKPRSAPPIPLGRISPETARALGGMEKRLLTRGEGTAAVYRGRGLTVFVCDDEVAFVETAPPRLVDLADFVSANGKPSRKIATPAGSTLVFRGLLADVVEHKVVTLVFTDPGAP